MISEDGWIWYQGFASELKPNIGDQPETVFEALYGEAQFSPLVNKSHYTPLVSPIWDQIRLKRTM
ncbi:hypothetical protein EB052_01210 [bacterium]|nr:hypothetical protein [bacterium]